MSKVWQLVFSGDFQIGGSFARNLSAGSPLLGPDLLQLLEATDYRVINLEGPITSAALVCNPEIDLRQPRESISILPSSGTTICNIANNHTTDAGEPGLRDTIATLNKEHFDYFGVKDRDACMLSLDGRPVALLGATLDDKDKDLLPLAQFRRLKKRISQLGSEGAQEIIVNIHGGAEYTTFPSPARRRLFRKLARLPRVAAVIGHHAHVVQGWEEENGTPIFYGLGNFIFDWPAHRRFPATRRGALLKMRRTAEKWKWEMVPVNIDTESGQSELTAGPLPDRINNKMFRINWARSAAAVISKRGKSSAKAVTKSSAARISFPRRLVRILLDPDKRPLFVYGTLFRIFMKTGLVK